MMQWLIYFGRWVVFAVHGILALAYRMVLFLSKRGSLFILPIVAALVFLEFHAFLLGVVVCFLLEFRPHHVPGPVALDVVLAVLFAVALVIYRRLARLLSVRRLLLVPVLAMMAVLWFRDPLHDELTSVVLSYPLRDLPDPFVIEAILVALLFVAFVLYQPLSDMLEVMLSTFPPINWPLPPVRPLRVQRRTITPVRVRVVVAKPPRWHWSL
jgi:hypothetical protein